MLLGTQVRIRCPPKTAPDDDVSSIRSEASGRGRPDRSVGVLHSPTLMRRTSNSPPVAKLGGAEHREFITKPIPLGHELYLRLFHYP